MKKVLSILLLVAAMAVTTTTACAQTANATDPKTEAQFIALEKAAWDAWKRQDAAWFQANIPDDFTTVAGGTRAGFIKGALNCQVTSYTLDKWKLTMLTPDVARLTYAAVQRAACGGNASPAHLQAASNYVRRNGRWWWVSLFEAPVCK